MDRTTTSQAAWTESRLWLFVSVTPDVLRPLLSCSFLFCGVEVIAIRTQGCSANRTVPVRRSEQAWRLGVPAGLRW